MNTAAGVLFLVHVFLQASEKSNAVSSSKRLQESSNHDDFSRLAKSTRLSIVNGLPAIGKRLFYAQLHSRHDGFFCGGTIIAKYWVLTTAACVLNKRDITVVQIGEGGDSRQFRGFHKVKEVIPHFKFDSGNMTSNIALLLMYRPIIRHTSNLLPLCPNLLELGTRLGACGLGHTSTIVTPDRFTLIPYKLRETYFLEDAFTPGSNPFEVDNCDETLICTESMTGTSSICDLDYGGPLYSFKCASFTPDCIYGVSSHALTKEDSSSDSGSDRSWGSNFFEITPDSLNKCDGGSFFTSVPQFYNWIKYTIISQPYPYNEALL